MTRKTPRKSIPIKNNIKLIKLPTASSTPVSRNMSDNSSLRKRKRNNLQEEDQVAVKRRRLKPGTRALQEIRYFQKSAHLLIPKLPFCRVVKEILLQELQNPNEYRIQAQALEALQAATEAFLVRFLEDSNTCAIHAKRVTLTSRDLRLVLYLKHGEFKI